MLRLEHSAGVGFAKAFIPCNAAVDGAALRGGLPRHALPGALLRLRAHIRRRSLGDGVVSVGAVVVVVVVGGGGVLAGLCHCVTVCVRIGGDRWS